MPPFSIFKAIRQIFARKSSTKVKSNRPLQLVQLEDRRMLNATFVFDGAAKLDLTGFNGASTELSISDTGAALTFTLNGGTWTGIDGGGVVGTGLASLTVAKSSFTNVGDQLDLNIVGSNSLDVMLGTNIVLPNSPTDGAFNISSDGDVTLAFTLDGAGNDFSIDTTGAISQTSSLSNIGSLDYDAGTTINITAAITTADTVDIDSTGLATIGAAGDINAGGAITFGAAKAGLLTTSGDIDTTDDNITFNRAVTLGGDVDFDTTGTAAGNIRFTSTIATAGNNLTLDAGPAGDIDLDAAATGGGDLVVRDGAVQEYNVLTFNSVDILDATTSVTFHNAVTVSANNANGGSDALKVNTPGTVTIDGTVTATAVAGLNIDIDPVNVNVNANMSANGDINLTASNNITIGAFTVRADADGVGGGTLDITSDDDLLAGGDISAAAGSTLRGNTVNLTGSNITTNIVTSDVGNLTITGANEVTLNDITTATAAQVIVNADANDVNVNATVNAATGVTLDAAGQNSDVIVNAAVTTAAGDITIQADDSVRFAAAGDVTATGAGNVLVNANRVNTVGDDGDQILMADGTIINGGSGTVTLTALGTNSGDITLGSVLTTNATATAVVITTAGGAIIDGGDTNVDIVANAAGARANLTAADGIGAGNAIETTVAILDARNTTGGSIEIAETDGIQVQRLLQDQDDSITLIAGGTIDVLAAGTGVIVDDAANAAGNADILLRSTAASVLINQIVRNDSNNADADITLDAIGQNSDVVVNAAVTTAAGDITIQADDSVRFAAAGDVTATGAGNVLVNANRVNTVGDDGDQILMADGTIINGGSGTVTLTALGSNSGNITLGSVQTANATAAAVIITTNNGNILDGGDADTDIITSVAGSRVTLTATNGSIGATSTDVFKGVFNPIELDLAGDLTANAPNGSVAITGPVAGTTTITATTGYITSAADINAATLTLTVTNLALITTGTLTIADTGLIVNGDLRIEANDVDAVTAGNPVILGAAGATQRINNLLYEVTLAADERVIIFADNLDVSTNSNVQLEVNGNSQFNDLDCDLTSFNNNGNTGVIVSIGGTITQGSDIGTIPGTEPNDKLLSQNLLLLGNGTICLDHVQNDVDTIAGQVVGAASLYFQDIDAITIGTVTSLFAVPAPAFPVLAYSGLQTANGDVHVVAGGTITVNQAISAGLSGNVLLGASGVNSDVAVNATVSSGTGHITFSAGRDIDLNADVTTANLGAGTVDLIAVRDISIDAVVTTANGDILINAGRHITQSELITTTNGDVGLVAGGNISQTATGDVTSSAGDVLVDAGGDWTMTGDAAVLANNTVITAGGQDFVGSAGGTITLGVISMTNATTNRVALQAGGSITDANGAAINIQETVAAAATSLSLRAGTIIGGAGGTTSSVNNQAIDLNVDTVAARAATGIYLREVAAGRAITVDNTSAVTVTIDGVRRSDFDSSTTGVSQTDTRATLEDLTTTAAGPIKLVAEDGTVTVNAGTAGTFGVSAGGASDVLLEARNGGNTGNDLIINADILSAGGHITLNAADDVDVNDVITTGGAGTVYINAANDNATGIAPLGTNGIELDGVVTTVNGDVLLTSASDIRQTALITSTNGDVGLVATNNITQTATGDITTNNGNVLMKATAGNWTMDGDTTITAGGGDVLGLAGNNIVLGVISATNAVANRVALEATNGSITDANGATINIQETVAAATTSVSLRAVAGQIGAVGGAVPRLNDNAIDLNVDVVAARSASGIYLRELAAGGSLTIDTAAAVTVTIDGARRSDFDSSTSAVSENDSRASLEDLTTTAGAAQIQVVVQQGALTVNSGTAATPGVHASGNNSAIYVEASGNVSIQADVLALNSATTLTADAAVAQNTLTLASVTGFAVGQTILIGDNDSASQTVTITAIAGNTLTVSSNFVSNYTLAQNAFARLASDVDDSASSTGESIVVRSVTGDILLGTINPVTISTDENPTPGGSSVETSDQIQLLAGAQSPLRADALSGQNQITLTDARGFRVGDQVNVSDSDSPAQSFTITAISGNPVTGFTITLSGNLASALNVNQQAVVEHPNLGAARFGGNITLRTDGGVAHQFAQRPVVGVANPNTAFISLQAAAFNAVINNQALTGLQEFLNVWQLQIGATGEENLRLDIDWRDPFNNPITGLPDPANPVETGGTPVNSDRTQIFYLDAGLNRIGHVYSLNDLLPFKSESVASFLSDFSVSQHDSIQVSGGTVSQNGFTDAVLNGRISSTDNIGTPSLVPPLPLVVNVADEADANRDFHFEGGLIKMLIPTVFLPPLEPEPAPPAPPAPPVAAPAPAIPVLVNAAPVEVADTPFSSYSTQSQDYFQLRVFDGENRNVVEKYEHIADEFGELLLQPARLKQWVADENLGDQTGLELWLITEKRTANGAVTVERPVLKFDIANGQPFPAKEDMPEVFEELHLSPMPLDDNLNPSATETPDGAAPSVDGPSSDTDNQPQDGEASEPEANDSQSLLIPSNGAEKKVSFDEEAEATVSSNLNHSVLMSVAVASVLNQSCPVSAAPSKSRQLLNRILNRQR